MKRNFYSNGKLLLTGEYAILDGATGLAIPTKFGQSLIIETSEKDGLFWKSLDHQGAVWFQARYAIEEDTLSLLESTDPKNGATLLTILQEAKRLNPEFLTEQTGFDVLTQLDFPQDWGLGSSSTLINNIASWAFVDAFELLEKSFGGSGYDIAAAQHDSPIFYTKRNPPEVRDVHLPWEFTDQLFFVHLNKKQDSKQGIQQFRNATIDAKELQKISVLTAKLLLCYELEPFVKIMEAHEQLISEMLQMRTIKEELFEDYGKLIKSLGAWGGDFVLASGNSADHAYFRKKGYNTIVPFSEMIL